MQTSTMADLMSEAFSTSQPRSGAESVCICGDVFRPSIFYAMPHFLAIIRNIFIRLSSIYHTLPSRLY